MPAPIVNGGGNRFWKWKAFKLSTARDLDLGSGHTAYRRASLIDLYLYTKFHSNRRNFLGTDGRTDGHFPPLTLLGRLLEKALGGDANTACTLAVVSQSQKKLGSAAGGKFWGPAYYSQRAVFASLWALFFIIIIIIKWWWREIWATVIHLVSSGDLGVVTHQISDDLGMTSTGRPRQARHVMLRRHGNSSSSSRDHSLIHDCTRRIF